MVVLGIDPGLITTGFGIIEQRRGKLTLLDSGALVFSTKYSIHERIKLFYEFFEQKITLLDVAQIALETPFFYKNAHVYLKLGYLRGILYLLAAQRTLVLQEFAPCTVKKAVTGSGKAEKEQVAFIIKKLFPGFVAQQKLDITDAVAVALCGAWQAL
jgi:crossover junction endodeoxyribonuclease RuvC